MKPFEHLAHRHPFVMLDHAEIIEPGKSARGVRRITANDPAVTAEGIFPAVFLIEAMAQTAGIASAKQTGSLLAGLRNITFSGNAMTGDTLETESIFEKSFSGIYLFTCRASVSGKTIAEGGILLYFADDGVPE